MQPVSMLKENETKQNKTISYNTYEQCQKNETHNQNGLATFTNSISNNNNSFEIEYTTQWPVIYNNREKKENYNPVVIENFIVNIVKKKKNRKKLYFFGISIKIE